MHIRHNFSPASLGYSSHHIYDPLDVTNDKLQPPHCSKVSFKNCSAYSIPAPRPSPNNGICQDVAKANFPQCKLRVHPNLAPDFPSRHNLHV